MSVKELKFDDDEEVVMRVFTEGNDLILRVSNPESESDVRLDRNQTHLLMLYLQEHLK